jgi:hypothetical protein
LERGRVVVEAVIVGPVLDRFRGEEGRAIGRGLESGLVLGKRD